MSAREDALTAIRMKMRDWQRGFKQVDIDADSEVFADLASDVWEPIVRALVDAKAGENEHGVFWQTSKLREAYRLAEEALSV